MKNLNNLFPKSWKNRSGSSFFSSRNFRNLCMLGIGVTLFTACTSDTENVQTPEQDGIKTDSFVLDQSNDFQIIDAKSADLSGNLDKATEAGGSDRGRFNITFRYLTSTTERQREVFDLARERWERIIIKDLYSISGEVIPSAFATLGVPPIITAEEGVIDDLVIEVVIDEIDGPGNILGQAGPRFVRIPELTTISGVMFFDVQDLDLLEEYDLFEEVIIHEMGHVLGIGTLWNINIPALGVARTLREGTGVDPYYVGEQANVFWNAEGGLYELPIEDMFGGGTRNSHWRESALDNELMTGFLNLGENPLSRITAGSVQDLGYGTARVGESYDLPRGTEGVEVGGTDSEKTEGLNIGEMEELLQPIGGVRVKK